jgi:predicted house-cleaning noncanonical NTP pyrophosphatase (MazG superfamily)
VSDLTPAPRGYPIKLVRDRTPQIINATGKPGALFYDHIEPAQRARWLRRKLIEEAVEYMDSCEVDELADVLAVVEGLAATHELTLADLIARKNADPRGGFLTGVMMRGHHPEFDGAA